jgi:hypothetical protein
MSRISELALHVVIQKTAQRFSPTLACIAHKFLDQPATLRPPATLREALRARRSDAGGEFVSDASSGSGILRLRRTIPLLFWREDFNLNSGIEQVVPVLVLEKSRYLSSR